MEFCPNCGDKLFDDNSKFCSRCGYNCESKLNMESVGFFDELSDYIDKIKNNGVVDDVKTISNTSKTKNDDEKHDNEGEVKKKIIIEDG